MQQLWNSQNQRQPFAYDEAALHRRIQASKNKASHLANANELGYMAISLVGSIILLIIGSHTFWSYATIAVLLAIGVLIALTRRRRLKIVNQYDQTLLGNLDHTLYLMNYQITSARKMAWWYILPLAVPSIMNMLSAAEPKPWWQWAAVLGSFVLGYLVVRLSISKRYLPQKRELEALKTKLEKA